jgi:hypothetical protein
MNAVLPMLIGMVVGVIEIALNQSSHVYLTDVLGNGGISDAE